MSTDRIYAMVTERILDLLENGTVPWHRPWAMQEPPKNLVSDRAYRGINTFLLASRSFASPYWLTFRQARERGGSVRKGEEATPVVFWKWVMPASDNDKVDEPARKPYPVLRYYQVFNVLQCSDIEVPAPPVSETVTEVERMAEAEAIIDRMPSPPLIEEASDRAYYDRRADLVNIPPLARFDSIGGYYSVLFHEITHSTGHAKRLARKAVVSRNFFGSLTYCQEELVAEMGAAFLCGQVGISNCTVENSAAYIQGWLQALKRDQRLMIVAAGQAQRAADYVLGRTPQAVPRENAESTSSRG